MKIFIVSIFITMQIVFLSSLKAQSNLLKIEMKPYYFSNEIDSLNHSYIEYKSGFKWDINRLVYDCDLISLIPNDTFKYLMKFRFDITAKRVNIPYKFAKTDFNSIIETIATKYKGPDFIVFKENANGEMALITYRDTSLDHYIHKMSLSKLFSDNYPEKIYSKFNKKYFINDTNTYRNNQYDYRNEIVLVKNIFSPISINIYQNDLRINADDTLSKIYIVSLQDSLGQMKLDKPLIIESNWISLTPQNKVMICHSCYDNIVYYKSRVVNDFNDIYNNPNAIQIAKWGTVFVNDSDFIFSLIDLNKFFNCKFIIESRTESSLTLTNNKGVTIQLDSGAYYTQDTLNDSISRQYHIANIKYDVFKYKAELPFMLNKNVKLKQILPTLYMWHKFEKKEGKYITIEVLNLIGLEIQSLFLSRFHLKLTFDSRTKKLKFIEIM